LSIFLFEFWDERAKGCNLSSQTCSHQYVTQTGCLQCFDPSSWLLGKSPFQRSVSLGNPEGPVACHPPGDGLSRVIRRVMANAADALLSLELPLPDVVYGQQGALCVVSRGFRPFDRVLGQTRMAFWVDFELSLTGGPLQLTVSSARCMANKVDFVLFGT